MANVETERPAEDPKTCQTQWMWGKKRRSRPFCVGPKSRTISSAELRWLCEEQGRGFEEDFEEDRGSPSSSRLSVLSSLSICSSIDSSSDSSPAESRLPRCMLTSRLRRRILLMKISVRYASTHNCVCDDCKAAFSLTTPVNTVQKHPTHEEINATLTHKFTMMEFLFHSPLLPRD